MIGTRPDRHDPPVRRITEDRSKIYAATSGRLGQAAPWQAPSQIAPFVSSARRQGEASLLIGLFVLWEVMRPDLDSRTLRAIAETGLKLGNGLCNAFEAYRSLHPEPQLSFEWAWNLYRCAVSRRELQLAWCALCEVPYVQDAYALDYRRCPFCEVKDHA
jgi:hypothetical protein